MGEWWWLLFTTGFWGALLQGDRLVKVVSHLPTAPHGLASGHQPQNCLLALATELSGCDPESEEPRVPVSHTRDLPGLRPWSVRKAGIVGLCFVVASSFGGRVSHTPGWPRAYYTAQDALKPLILLVLPLSAGISSVPYLLDLRSVGDQSQGTSCMLGACVVGKPSTG